MSVGFCSFKCICICQVFCLVGFCCFKYVSICQIFNLDKKCKYTLLYSEDIVQILLNSVGYGLIHITYIHIMNECLVSHSLNLFTIDGELCIVLLVDFYSYIHKNCCSCFQKYITVVFLLFSFFGIIFLLPKEQYACLFTHVWSFDMYLQFFLKVDNAYFSTVFWLLDTMFFTTVALNNKNGDI